jgi:hypothetical protein
MSTIEYIRNPISNRIIRVGGDSYKKLLRQGMAVPVQVAGCTSNVVPALPTTAEEAAATAGTKFVTLPPPPEGMIYVRKHDGGVKLRKKPDRMTNQKALEAAAASNLRYKGVNIDEETLKAEVAKLIHATITNGCPGAAKVNVGIVSKPDNVAPVKPRNFRLATSSSEVGSSTDFTSGQESEQYYTSSSGEEYEEPPIPTLRRSASSSTPARPNPRGRSRR